MSMCWWSGICASCARALVATMAARMVAMQLVSRRVRRGTPTIIASGEFLALAIVGVQGAIVILEIRANGSRAPYARRKRLRAWKALRGVAARRFAGAD